MRFIKLFTSFSGRVSRSWFWLGFVTVVVVFGLGRYFIKTWRGDEIPGPDSVPVMLWSLVGMIALTAVIVKRFNDRDWPSWLGWLTGAALVLPIPITYLTGFLGDDIARYSLIEHIIFWPSVALSLFALIDNGFLRGTRGPNRYGPEPGSETA